MVCCRHGHRGRRRGRRHLPLRRGQGLVAVHPKPYTHSSPAPPHTHRSDALDKFSVVGVQLAHLSEALRPLLRHYASHPRSVNQANAPRLPLALATRLLPEQEAEDAALLAEAEGGGGGGGGGSAEQQLARLMVRPPPPPPPPTPRGGGGPGGGAGVGGGGGGQTGDEVQAGSLTMTGADQQQVPSGSATTAGADQRQAQAGVVCGCGCVGGGADQRQAHHAVPLTTAGADQQQVQAGSLTTGAGAEQ